MRIAWEFLILFSCSSSYYNIMQILIAEDEVKIAKFIRRGLMEESYVVDIASSGEEAYINSQ